MVWDTAVRQCGAIRVSSIEELIDVMKALVYFPVVKGDRVGITGGSGGQSVVTADVFAEANLRVPPLTKKSYDKLATFFDLTGGGYRNPIDTANANGRRMKEIIEVLEKDDNVDNVVLLMNAHARVLGHLEDNINMIIQVKKTSRKPVMTILSWTFSPEGVKQAGEIIAMLRKGGVPAFVSPERCAFALRKAFEYYDMKDAIGSV